MSVIPLSGTVMAPLLMVTTGHMAFQCQVGEYFSLFVLVYEVTMCMYLTSGSSSTCIQQSAPEGFFRDQECRQLNFFVCEILAGNGFSEPPEGTHI